jgi:pyruvate dehydrogenase E2 component (dihydrolipoamide acetyltransferase)
MPKMGDGMEEGTLLAWLKKEGDKVKSGEVIGEIQTDKATLELESPGTGILAGILLKEGGTVPVGVPIAAILKDGESLPSDWGSGGSKPSAPAAETPAATPQAVEATPSAPADTRIKASPLARKIAAEKGIDLSTIQGTGPGGRIVERDVQSAAPSLPASAGAPAASTPPAVVASAEDQTISISRLRQITAKRTLESKTQVPHFYVSVEVDVERIMALREMFKEEESGNVSVNDFVIKACALALREMPEVNATFQAPASLVVYGGVHIGMAVAVPDGLTVPVIHNADQLTLRQIAAKSKDLAARAKENKLSLDELSGSTFSISNMGMLDVDEFLAIVNQPNAAILAVASARKQVVVGEDDEIEIRRRMRISMSFDHRVVDGAVGARFINLVKKYLENPTKLIN